MKASAPRSNPLGPGLLAASLVAILLIVLARQPLPDHPSSPPSTGNHPGLAELLGRDASDKAPPKPVRKAQPHAEDQRFSERMAAIRQWIRADPGLPKAMAPIQLPQAVDPALRPRQQPLTERQSVAMANLRWNVPGKHLEFRTGETHASLRWLEAQLLEPRSDVLEDGLTREETTARRLLRKIEDAMGIADADAEFAASGTGRGDGGYSQVRFQQRFGGLEVWPGAITVQLDPNGHAHLLTGAYVPTPRELDMQPKLTPNEAVAAARRHAVDGLPAMVNEVVLVVHGPVYREDANLAYKVDLHASLNEHWAVFVDAHSGGILDQISHVCTAHTTGSGEDLTGQTRTVNLWNEDGTYFMIDTTKAMYDTTSTPPNIEDTRGTILILDAGGQRLDAGSAQIAQSSTPNGDWPQSAVSAARSFGFVYDYFLDRFERNSLDGQGANLLAIVNLDIPNANFMPHLNGMGFSNSDVYAEALDVVGHEMTHGVIFHTSNLVYQDESGALNESFADIIGEHCEAHFNPEFESDWIMGTALNSDLIKRSFPNPADFGDYPSRYSQYLVTNSDHGGVHTNSSIINHCFYLLAEGLPGAIGREEALRIFYNAVTTKLNRCSQFVDARLGCIQAAEEIFGAGSTQATKTAEAFDDVEIFDVIVPNTYPALPVVGETDMVMFLFQFQGQTYVGRRDPDLGDDPAGVFLGDGQRNTALPGKRMTVSGDGTMGAYITPNSDAAFINTVSGAVQFLGEPGNIGSVAISPSGNLTAVVLNNADETPGRFIRVFNAQTNQTTTFEASNPQIDSEDIPNTVVFVDTIDISADDRFIYYDALNRLTLNDNRVLEFWGMYSIDLESNLVLEIFPLIPTANIGNPSLASTRTNLLTFDFSDKESGMTEIAAFDLKTGDLVATSALRAPASIGVGWPGYSGDDTAIIYTDYEFVPAGGFWRSLIVSQPVQADGASPRGEPFPWLDGAGDTGPHAGVIYRRGDYQGLPGVGVVAVTGTTTEGGASGVFRVSRSGPTTNDLPFRFTLTGSATNGLDFVRTPTVGTVPAGSASVDILINAIEDGVEEGSESVTLTLSEGLHYTITDSSAMVTVSDGGNGGDDETFARWAATWEIEGFGEDFDLDGYANGIEYALGTNPRVAESVPRVNFRSEAGFPGLEILRNEMAGDVDYIVEVSSTMAPGEWTSVGTLIEEDTPQRLRVRTASSMAAQPGQYLRLRVALK